MTALLIKSSLAIIVLLAFYKIVLEKESFFSVNRFYLLASLFIAFLIPFITLPKMVEHQGYVDVLMEKRVIDNDHEYNPSGEFILKKKKKINQKKEMGWPKVI